MMSLRYEVMTHFTSQCRQRRFKTFDLMLRAPGVQTKYAKGWRGRLPSLAGLRNQGLVQKGQPEARGFQSIP